MTVVLGPVGAVDRDGLEMVDVVSAEDMAREVLSRVEAVDCVHRHGGGERLAAGDARAAEGEEGRGRRRR